MARDRKFFLADPRTFLPGSVFESSARVTSYNYKVASGLGLKVNRNCDLRMLSHWIDWIIETMPETMPDTMPDTPSFKVLFCVLTPINDQRIVLTAQS